MTRWQEAFRGQRVLVTGHTGFKGSWLCEWLLGLGAEVTGLALQPPTQPSLFEQLRLSGRLRDQRVDLRDLEAVVNVWQAVRPQIVFHLAAQSLVREGFRAPWATFGTNTMGTANLLEAARRQGEACAIVVATTDKCYENDSAGHIFGEDAPLGGHDPYSASKAAAELVVTGYRGAFEAEARPIAVATARAGNVIGGGDWAVDRLVPDFVRAAAAGQPVVIRHPTATRPWQHVAEPLAGYLQLAVALTDPQRTRECQRAFNFGPSPTNEYSVCEVTALLKGVWPCRVEELPAPTGPKEAGALRLDSTRAERLLGWRPVWTCAQAVQRTARWYRDALEEGRNAQALVQQDLDDYTAALTGAGQPPPLAHHGS
jgi:CDP-glucose 4,6-dehydratase